MNRPVNPVMITLARESRGRSQSALAKRLDVSQAAVSKLENGQIKADDEILSALIDYFDYPESFFCRPFEIYPMGMQFYRKHKTLPAKVSKRIEAMLNIYRLHVSQLLVAAEVAFTPLPDLDVDRYGRAWKVARALRHYLKLPAGPIANVIEVLEKLGIVVVQFDPETSMFSGVSMVLNTQNYLILVNSQMPADRLRWTLVHEFAHIIIHSLPSETMEAEAEEFTGEFLMPSEEIRLELKGLTIEKLAALKRRWKVSMNAIVTNAHKRRMITDWEDRMLRIKMASNGITRTREPVLGLQTEKPSLLSELLDFHLHDLEYSLPEVSNLVALHEAELLTKLQPALRRPTVVARTRPKLSLVHSR